MAARRGQGLGPLPSLSMFSATSTWSWAQKCKCLTCLLCLTSYMGVKLGTWRKHNRNDWKWRTTVASKGFWVWRSWIDTTSFTSRRFAKPSHWPCCLGNTSWDGYVTLLGYCKIGTFHIALLTHLQGAHYPCGYPQHSFAVILKGDFLAVGIPIHGGEWYEQAHDKKFWQPMVHGLKLESQTLTWV